MAVLSEFGASLETTREWIEELMQTMQTDEAQACRAFRAVTQELRNHLTLAETADLSAQLPLLLRGVFYDGWTPSKVRQRNRSKEKFLQKVSDRLPRATPIGQVEKMVREVFMFLDRKVSPGEIRHVVGSLPKDLQPLWPEYARSLQRA